MSLSKVDAAADYFRALHQMVEVVNSSLDVMQVLHDIASRTVDVLAVKACAMRLLSPDGRRLFVGAAHGLSPNYRTKGPVDVAHSDVDRLALEEERPIQILDVGADSRVQYPTQARDEGIASLVVAPLRVQGCPVGVLRVYTGVPREFQDEELALVEAIAGLSALAIENARLYERLHRNYQAAVDFSDCAFV